MCSSNVSDYQGLKAAVQNLSGAFEGRSGALSALTLALLAHTGKPCCVSHLSLQTAGKYTHSGLLAGLEKGSIDTDVLLRKLYPLAAGQAGFKNVVIADCTSWLRPEGHCVDQRGMVRDAKSARRGLHADAGWEFSLIGAETAKGVFPLLCERIEPGADKHAFVINQLERVSSQASGTLLSLHDAGYSAANLAYLAGVRELDVTFLVRLAKNQVFYKGTPADPEVTRGRPRRHHERLEFKNPQLEPDLHLEYEDLKLGQVSLRGWCGMHQKLRKQSSGMAEVGKYPIESGTVVQVQAAKWQGRSMWLFYTGDVTVPGFSLGQLVALYTQRFDIEHGFRFAKQTLGWTCYNAGSAAAADTWTGVVIMAWALTCLCRHLASAFKLPWEKPLEGHSLTLGRIKRAILGHVRKLLALVVVPKIKTRPVGRTKGQCWGPKTRHPVHVAGGENPRTARR